MAGGISAKWHIGHPRSAPVTHRPSLAVVFGTRNITLGVYIHMLCPSVGDIRRGHTVRSTVQDTAEPVTDGHVLALPLWPGLREMCSDMVRC
jgi:hypothetical protein